MRNICLGVAICLLIACAARANVITFETTPTGSEPADDSPLSSVYSFSGGTVRFFFDNNGNNSFDAATDLFPHFERSGTFAGESVHGFLSTQSSAPFDTARTPALAAQLGNFFLRKEGDINSATPVPFVFIAAYATTTPIRSLSGEVWDIDGDEQWRVDVLDHNGAVLANLLSPAGMDQTDPASLDGKPWLFAFNNLPDGVENLRFTFVGAKASGVGLAFNNFSPDLAVPEPSAALLLLVGSGALLQRRRHAEHQR